MYMPQKNDKGSKPLGKHLTIILKEMCKRVKAKYEGIDFKSPDWFRTYKWSLQQQGSFETWLAGYLHRNGEALQELCDRQRQYVNKSWCLKAAKEFTFMYGWSLSDYPSQASQDQTHKTE